MTVQDDKVSGDGPKGANASQEDKGLLVSVNKESEPRAKTNESDEFVEIKSRGEAADRQAVEVLKASLKEARGAVPEPELPADVEDAGVHSPQSKADEIVARGSTLELNISEESFEKGKATKVTGNLVRGAVVGVSSISALAIWIGRMVNMAHKRAKKIVFRSSAKVEEKKGVRDAG